ncbi:MULTISPECIES: PIN domain-containing protein [unclassified Wenzhouxiangella]|uniref:PIN domain-containing protein n=1 Tax=unclassified Wenzhouxiangella TaxID=2613841 RepID=UPI000E328137|nr:MULTISPECIES: PIN domain-containing protein [unclassified Wenzhouxiangella]RFF27883.1 PIN domain-containing protein [Wenzhouxiangella sp. 15181]RFP68991.1 PIN domain-containing protein [Wenzhouxiangella sp. 15190]
MTDLYFVDTNILVYARDTAHPAKHSQARNWLEHLWKTRTGRISTQVLKEYYQVVTRRLKPGLPREQARADIHDLWTWEPVETDQEVFEQAWSLEDRLNYNWWDLLILAAAQRSNCIYVLSEDLQNDQTIDNLKILNPFTTTINDQT